MEEFESYFESLNFNFSNWNDILETENIDIRSNNTTENSDHSVQLLPRQDVSLYGIMPKMERRSFSLCKECNHVFNPKDVLLHKNCTFKVSSQNVSHFKKKVIAKKKSAVPLPPLFQTGLEGVSPLEKLNTTPLHPNSIFIVNASELQPIPDDVKPMEVKPSSLVQDVGDIPLPSMLNTSKGLEKPTPDKPTTSDEASKTPVVHSSSSKSKERKYSKPHRETDTSCVVEYSKGPFTRSINYSNHSSANERFLRNMQGLILEDSYFSPNNTEEIPVSVPVFYLPMSPVSPINPLQIIQDGKLVCLETPLKVQAPTSCPRKVYVNIPEQLNYKTYKTRPKPATVQTYGARKVGGAVVTSKQKCISQRNAILGAIEAKHEPSDVLTNYKSTSFFNNTQPRSNILKSKNTRINLKRSIDKQVNNELNHIRLAPEMNGFIIHNDVNSRSEVEQDIIHDVTMSVRSEKRRRVFKPSSCVIKIKLNGSSNLIFE